MLLASFTTGIILIICGFLVKEYPNLIAGYNTLSEEKKKNIDIDGLSGMMRQALVIIGTLIIITGCVLYFLKIKEHYGVLILGSVVVIGIFIMTIIGQKFSKKN